MVSSADRASAKTTYFVTYLLQVPTLFVAASIDSLLLVVVAALAVFWNVASTAPENVLLEPEGRNTAPCLALCLVALERRFGNGVMAVLSADHWIGGKEAYLDDLDRAMGHAEAAARLPDLRALWAEVFKREPRAQPADVDEDLYGGFVGGGDRGRLQRLRELAPEQLASKRLAFDDARLEEIVFRYRARNFPDTLSSDERARWDQHRAARLHAGEGGALTVEAFFERIDALSETADEGGQEILAALYDWADQIAPER